MSDFHQIKAKVFIRKYTDKPNINGHTSLYFETANVLVLSGTLVREPLYSGYGTGEIGRPPWQS